MLEEESGVSTIGIFFGPLSSPGGSSKILKGSVDDLGWGFGGLASWRGGTGVMTISGMWNVVVDRSGVEVWTITDFSLRRDRFKSWSIFSDSFLWIDFSKACPHAAPEDLRLVKVLFNEEMDSSTSAFFLASESSSETFTLSGSSFLDDRRHPVVKDPVGAQVFQSDKYDLGLLNVAIHWGRCWFSLLHWVLLQLSLF